MTLAFITSRTLVDMKIKNKKMNSATEIQWKDKNPKTVLKEDQRMKSSFSRRHE